MSMKGGELSPNELKNLINESYKGDTSRQENIGNFVYDKDLSNNKASVYHNTKTGQATIVHRGTNSTATDWSHNLSYALGLYDYTNRSKKGKDTQKAVEEKYGAKNVSTIGHSQGAINARNYGKNTHEIINLNEAYTPSLKYRKPSRNEK